MKIKGLRVDPSSGMASPSVKSVSVDGPGPAESSTTPTQSSDLCPFTVDCHVKHVEPLWNHDHSPTVNEIHPVVKKKKGCCGPCLANRFRHKIRVFPEDQGLLWSVNVSAPETA